MQSDETGPSYTDQCPIGLSSCLCLFCETDRAPFQLYIGLSASCGMLILAVILTRRTKGMKYADVDISGLLQMAWMLGDPHLSNVEKPDLDKLRSAGMYMVDSDTLILRRLNSSSVTNFGEGSASVDQLVSFEYDGLKKL